MKIYTRTGDGGETGLFGGGRVPKDHVRVEAYGTVDELNAVLGWCAAVARDPDIVERLSLLQHDLFTIGSHLASPPPAEGRSRPTLPPLPEERSGQMEEWIDAADAELPPLRDFVLPGGTPSAAALHLARTVCRRAERAAVALSATEEVDGRLLIYLNRLSDLIFAFARLENARAGVGDVVWRKGGQDG